MAISFTVGGIKTFPNRLEFVNTSWVPVSNGITFSWMASAPVSGLSVELDNTSGQQLKALNIGGSNFPATSGAETMAVPTPGIDYLLKANGTVNGSSTEVGSAPFSSPSNTPSLRAFLTLSGIGGSNGIRKFFTHAGGSVRGAMRPSG